MDQGGSEAARQAHVRAARRHARGLREGARPRSVISAASGRHEVRDVRMRGLISGICVAGALLLTAASMFMNWSFWTGQGGDASSSQVLGAVSIGIDVFKATLPLVYCMGVVRAPAT